MADYIIGTIILGLIILAIKQIYASVKVSKCGSCPFRNNCH